MHVMFWKIKKVTRVGRKKSVFSGKKNHTSGLLTKADLTRNKHGRIVSIKASQSAKNRTGMGTMSRWGQAVKQAREDLHITGFCCVGGGSMRGKF